MNIINKLWYPNKDNSTIEKIFLKLLYSVLLPFSFIYFVFTVIRIALYKHKLIKSYKCRIPVIVIGNIVSGGSGKTPVVISLALALKHKKLNVGIISRGYKAKIINPIIINNNHNANQVGDEPLLIFQKTHLPICVHSNRVLAIETLLNTYQDLDVIISDDGLQHLKMQRDIECVVFNNFETGNNTLLPSGPLRENIRKWDYSLYSGDNISNKIIHNSQSKAVKSKRVNKNLYNMKSNEIKSISDFKNQNILIAAGIAHPQNIKKLFDEFNINANIYFNLNDHQELTNKHILEINKNYHEYNIIIITEKDLVKYNKNSLIHTLNKEVWVLNLEALIPNDFIQDIFIKIQKNK